MPPSQTPNPNVTPEPIPPPPASPEHPTTPAIERTPAPIAPEAALPAPAAPPPAPPPGVALPAAPLAPPPPAPAPASPPPPTIGPTPAVAGDVDVIEKEWVDQANKIIEQTKGDPYVEEEAEEALQQDYLKKRYNHDVKKPDAT